MVHVERCTQCMSLSAPFNLEPERMRPRDVTRIAGRRTRLARVFKIRLARFRLPHAQSHRPRLAPPRPALASPPSRSPALTPSDPIRLARLGQTLAPRAATIATTRSRMAAPAGSLRLAQRLTACRGRAPPKRLARIATRALATYRPSHILPPNRQGRNDGGGGATWAAKGGE